MHYSSIIQTERNHWGKTPKGSGQHTHTHKLEYHTHLPNWGMYSAVGATKDNAKSRLPHLRWRAKKVMATFSLTVSYLLPKNVDFITLTGKYLLYFYSVCQLCNPKHLCVIYKV